MADQIERINRRGLVIRIQIAVEVRAIAIYIVLAAPHARSSCKLLSVN